MKGGWVTGCSADWHAAFGSLRAGQETFQKAGNPHLLEMNAEYGSRSRN